MSSPAYLAHLIGQMAPERLQINLWPTETGFQANVKELPSKAWTCTHHEDPVEALLAALKQRIVRHQTRDGEDGTNVPLDGVAAADDAELAKKYEGSTKMRDLPEQIDLEEAIAAKVAADDIAGFGL